MTLYNCRHDGDLYRITKFDDDMNVESSYLTDGEACDCPAGVRPTCRHRQMLPRFLSESRVGTEWFFDFDRGGWVQGEATFEPTPPPPEQPHGVTGSTADFDSASIGSNPIEAAIESDVVGEPALDLPEDDLPKPFPRRFG